MDILSFMGIVVYIIVPSLQISLAVDSIRQSQILSDGKTLVSEGGTFELGFFSPGNSKKHYLGIWYKNIPIQTVVWVANRLNPINDSSGVLTLNNTGSLVLRQNEIVVWYTTSQIQVQNPVAQLLDSGNLVVKDENEANPERYLWQSFDFPTDTLMAGMKFGWDFKIGLNRRLSAWKSPEDPSPGDFSWGIELYNYPDSVLRKGTEKYYRAGAWNGLYPSGAPEVRSNSVFDFNFVSNKDELYFMYRLRNSSVIARVVLNQTDYIRYCYVWVQTDQNWRLCASTPKDDCDLYGRCGVYGICNIAETPACQCLRGFRPKSPPNWNAMDWSQGCVRNKTLSCKDKLKDGFVKLVGLKLPDTAHAWRDKTIGLEQCREKCSNNCSCMAYTSSDIRGEGSGCAMWFGNLIDIRQVPIAGQDLYIRMDASEIELKHGHRKKLTTIVATTVTAVAGMLVLGFCIHKVHRKITEKSKYLGDENSGEHEDLDLPLLDLSTIATATDNFSMINKIGECGFGPVYKGRLQGQDVAVKRLSSSSGQGITEFKNEVKFIVKLQHRNLVKLLGCCIQGQEKMLVYEYMPNSSLDSFIFDDTNGKLLNWSKRYNIICGITRGLTYLHQDSRLRIIHRDLKASNILLDDRLNPKISDFGLARTFGGDQTEGNTKRVVGTYGYMVPEYAADGLFSIKSDVFSFGILLLEIICGKRNKGFYHPGHNHNLVGHAWRLWKEGSTIELIDTNIKDSCILAEVLRCIHVSLLCVQHYPEDRPDMHSVILMLRSEIELAEPKQPGFFPRKSSIELDSSPPKQKLKSTNELTITLMDGR